MTLFANAITKDYGHVRALKGADITLESGEVRALLGGNGSGKSTMSKILTGVTAPSTGGISIDGAPVSINGPRDASTLGIAATYQEVALAGDLTVAENLGVTRLPRRFGILSAPNRHRSLLTESLERVSLNEDILGERVRDLDLEQRSLVELARVLGTRPRYVVFDELTASLRAHQVDLVGDIIRELADDGAGILFVSHRLEEVERFCDVATVLRSGRVVLDGSLKTLTIEDLVTAMTGEKQNEGDRRRTVRASISAGATVLSAEDLLVDGAAGPVSVHSRAGEILGVAGLSGQGQGEMLRALAGTSRATGRILVGTKSMNSGKVDEFVSCGVGFVSGERDREMSFGVRNVDENARSVSLTQRRSIDIGAILETLKLPKSHRRAMMSGLSGGQQQKVVLGRWLTMSPVVLVADDPTRGVDIGARREIHRLLRKIAEAGTGVVLTSSDDHELAEICDRVLIVYRGQIVQELTGDNVTEQQIADASVRSGTSTKLSGKAALL